MLSCRLSIAATTFCKLNRSTCLIAKRNFARKSDDDIDSLDKPLPYSSSAAASWKAQYSRMPPNERVWFTPYVASGSVAIFLLYFCVFREENDIDEIIYRPLPETIKGIDKAYPEYDFNTKPDYVIYHENQKAKKQQTELERQVAAIGPR